MCIRDRVDRAEVEVVDLDGAEVAFDVREVLVGADHTGRVEGVVGDGGADDVDAVQGRLGLNLFDLPGHTQAGVGDGDVEVFGHLVRVPDLADLEPDLVRADQPAGGHCGDHGSQDGFGGGEQLAAFAGTFDGEERVAARDQAFPG